MANSMVSEVARSYNSFSGSDIRARIGPISFAEMQAISYSISREKAPIYCMGSADPRSYSRNKRGIAGSFVWVNFDRHELLAMIKKMKGQFCANKDDIHPAFLNDTSGYESQIAVYNTTLVRDSADLVGATIDSFNTIGDASASAWKTAATPWYSDQILPFDVTMSGTNEMGAATAMKIFGVEILNEGYGVSIDDSVSEMQSTFVARGIEPWQAVQTDFAGLTS